MLWSAILVLFAVTSVSVGQGGQSLANTHLKIVVIDSPPFIVTEENDTYVGFMIDMLEEFQNRLGFTYELYKVPDGHYGRQDEESGEWTGLIGEVVSGNADMVLAPLTITSRRVRHVLFTAPWMQAGIVPLFKKPQPGEKLPFQSIMDLVTETDLKYGAIADGGTYSFFKDNRYRLYKAMGEYMTNNSAEVMARSVMEAAARVREGGYVFLGEQEQMKWLVGDEPCDLMTVGKPINARAYGLAFPKESESLAATFSREIMEMKENGMFQVFQDQWWEDDCKEPKLCVCEANNSGEASSAESAQDEQTGDEQNGDAEADNGAENQE